MLGDVSYVQSYWETKEIWGQVAEEEDDNKKWAGELLIIITLQYKGENKCLVFWISPSLKRKFFENIVETTLPYFSEGAICVFF